MQATKTLPIQLEVIAHTFQGLGLCTNCELVMAGTEVGELPHERALAEYPLEWQDDWTQLTAWVNDLAAQHGDRIYIRVIDPQSAAGLWKSLRYRVRRYPTWIVDGRARIVGWDRQALEVALERAGKG